MSQFEKAMLVSKLKGARDRVRRIKGKCGGRKSHVEKRPEMVARAWNLRRYRRLSFRGIAAQLAQEGFSAASGRPLEATTVRRMLANRRTA